MAAGVATQHLCNRVGFGIDDQNRCGERIGSDHILSVRAHGCLNRQAPDRPGHLPANGIVVFEQVYCAQYGPGCGVDHRYRTIKKVGYIVLACVRHHPGRNRMRTNGYNGLDLVLTEIVDRRVGAEHVWCDHGLAVVAHPVSVRFAVSDVDPSQHIFSPRRQFDHRIRIFGAVEGDMYFVIVHSRHDVGRGLSDRNVANELAGAAVKHCQLAVEPLGLVDQRLIAIRPHVMGVVHLDTGQCNLAPACPGSGIEDGGRARLVLPRGQLELCVHPHFAHARNSRLL